MTTRDLALVRYCAEEVERQQDRATAVHWMVEAWQLALRESAARRPLGVGTIEMLGALVHPEKNANGFRRVGVRVGMRVCPAPDLVPRLMANFVEGLPSLTPEDAYREFQEIHPFRDGNGRTGKIIFNWLRGTLSDPQMPPNLFGCANP